MISRFTFFVLAGLAAALLPAYAVGATLSSQEIVAQWKFDSGNFLADSSGNGHALSNFNAVQSTDTPNSSSGSAYFDGNSMLYTVSTLDLSPYDVVRVSWWQKVTSNKVGFVYETKKTTVDGNWGSIANVVNSSLAGGEGNAYAPIRTLAPTGQWQTIAQWDFESGDFLGDSSGNGNILVNYNGTAAQSSDTTDGSSGSAYFNGNAMLHTLDTLDLSPYTAVRLSWWQKVEGSQTGFIYESKNTNSNPGAIANVVNSGGVGGPGNAYSAYASSGGYSRVKYPFSSGSWQKFTAMYYPDASSVNQELTVYDENGDLVSTYDMGANATLPFGNFPLHLGARGDGGLSNGMSGYLDNFVVEGVVGVPPEIDNPAYNADKYAFTLDSWQKFTAEYYPDSKIFGNQVLIYDGDDNVIGTLFQEGDVTLPFGDYPMHLGARGDPSFSDGMVGYLDDITVVGAYAVDPAPGDANDDGSVNEADALILAQNWLSDFTGTTFTWSYGDFNNDKRVDEIDATMLAANWGKSFGVHEGSSAVPEPGTAIMLAVVLLAAAFGRLRRRC